MILKYEFRCHRKTTGRPYYVENSGYPAGLIYVVLNRTTQSHITIMTCLNDSETRQSVENILYPIATGFFPEFTINIMHQLCNIIKQIFCEMINTCGAVNSQNKFILLNITEIKI